MSSLSPPEFGHWHWTGSPVERIADGIDRQMLWGDRLMICRLFFAAGVVTPMHSHPHEQMTLVERGTVRFQVAGVDHVASAGDVLLFPAGVEHGATILDQPAVVLDIFSPPREEFLRPLPGHDLRPSCEDVAPDRPAERSSERRSR